MTCPKCKSKATKRVSLDDGLITCQICGHSWSDAAGDRLKPPKREHAVASAGYWFDAARSAQNEGRMADALMAMENAYNHLENALAAEQSRRVPEQQPNRPCPKCGYKSCLDLSASSLQQPVIAMGEQQPNQKEALLEKFYDTWVRCESTRGCYSCCREHDCRCPKDQHADKECVCGRDQLNELENQILTRHVPAPQSSGTTQPEAGRSPEKKSSAAALSEQAQETSV